ncbi:MAG: porin [Verrucomicrobiota bacterium]
MKQTMNVTKAGTTAMCFCLIQATAIAGEPPAIEPAPEPTNDGDWCTWLSEKPGIFYKNSDNPWIQEFGLGGRFHWNAAYIQGNDINGYGFSDTHTEVRRFRLEPKLKFLNFFEAYASINMVDDATNRIAPWPGGRKLGWGYETFDQAHLTFDAKKAFSIDSVDGFKIKYGRLKHEITHEAWTSSKKLLTVERSAISNKVFGSALPTGFSFNVVKGDWDFWASIYSTDAITQFGGNTEFIGGWGDGLAYRTSVGYQATEDLSLRWDFIYNDADGKGGDDSLFRYKWVTSLSAVYDQDQWGLITDMIYGDNGGRNNGVLRQNRQGDFWGLVLMPYYWIVDDKLQGVVRYYYQGSQNAAGIRVYSRYARADHGPVVNTGINGGRGNEHHSIYAGVNYYLCGQNVKLQTGLEYEWLNTPGAGIDGEFSALTYWFGFRSYF